ncbi:MAG: guanylate kinase [Synergistaceae bacterium]|nr:guanylate kinase [Synergistota bacterium]NLM70926.1 guanylate kinase [Synergistaceae bacterium]
MSGKQRGRLFVLSGPSGAGKGTLRKIMFEGAEGITFSVSCTTRPPREGEREGVDYRFISKEDFLDRLRIGDFLEHAVVHGEYYGTLREDVNRVLESGEDILLEIDVQGALQVRESMPESVLLFVTPPSFEELEKRLRDRGTETEDLLKLRLCNARREMEQLPLYDYVIVNDCVERAARELKGIISTYGNDEKQQGGVGS